MTVGSLNRAMYPDRGEPVTVVGGSELELAELNGEVPHVDVVAHAAAPLVAGA